MAISKKLREFVTQRAKGFCEYCQTTQSIVIEMEIDHIKPESDGGRTVEDNLCLTCGGCNSFKHDAQVAVDPETLRTTFLFNPRKHSWYTHFKWSTDGTRLIGKTSIGRATVEKLKINRELAVRARERWVKAGWHPPKLNDLLEFSDEITITPEDE